MATVPGEESGPGILECGTFAVLEKLLFHPRFEREPERFSIFGYKTRHCWLTLLLSSPLI